jgi:hypothetical protein
MRVPTAVKVVINDGPAADHATNFVVCAIELHYSTNSFETKIAVNRILAVNHLLGIMYV